MGSGQDNEDALLGARAVEMGLINARQLKEALTEQTRLAREEGESPSLGYVLVAKKLIPEQQLVSLLWDEELMHSDQEIRDFLDSFDAPKAQLGTDTQRLPLKESGFGKYQLVREAGRGGMAVVYEARDGERRVALKMLLASSRIDPKEAAIDEERFIREARLSQKIPEHPNIVSVLETGVIDSKRFIAMEYIDGREMGQWWRRSYASTRMQVRVLRDVALAIHHAHHHGVIHRDLKPANILIDDRNQPHVTDFGLARGLKRANENSLTLEDRVVGTPHYMSPEQAEGKKNVDRRSDVYSLGVLLYEMMAGRPPFLGGSAMEVMVKVARDPVPLPSAALKKGLRSPPDKGLEAICMRALAKSPKDRTASAKLFADELTTWLREQGTGKGNLKAYRMFAWTGIAAGVVAVVVLALALLGVFSPAPPPPAPPKKPKPVAKPPEPRPAPPPPPTEKLAAWAVEAEAILDAAVTHGTVSAQKTAGCSGNAQLFWTGGRPQSRLTVPIRVDVGGQASLTLRMMKAQDYGIVRLSLNGEQISDDLDLYSPTVVASGPLRFTRLAFKKGLNELEIKIVGSNSKASPATAQSDLFQVGLDRLELTP
ncbi:MAG TPA: serine/threonine-protein kinase [Planctomycetota bacterium]